MIRLESTRSLRRAYLEWVEEQIEEFKDSIPRSELLRLADQVVEELRLSRRGQYQLTELLLCDAVDRKIFRMLKLPGYKRWCASQEAAVACGVEPHSPVEEEILSLPAAVACVEEDRPGDRPWLDAEERLRVEIAPSSEPVPLRPRKDFPVLGTRPIPVRAMASL